MGTKYLPHIDGLRAVAVLSVVAYHAGLPLPGGFVGVDVFFVISGFLITGLLAKEWRETGRIDLAAFYARRIRRILPALFVVVSATLLLGSWLLSSKQLDVLARSAIASMAMIGNVFFNITTADYFASASAEMPLLHLWSLGVEEQFYLIWPLLLMGVLRTPRSPVIVAALALVSLAIAHHWLQSSASMAFFQMPARFWELAAGGLLALHPPRWGRWAAYAGSCLVLIALVAPLPVFPGIGAVPAVVGSVLIIAAAEHGAVGRLLAHRRMVYIGLISYSLYLWHWPLLALNRAVSLTPPTIQVSLALCVVAVVIAALSHRYVELPFRRIKAQDGSLIGFGFTASAIVMVMAGVIFMQQNNTNALSERTASDRQDRSCTIKLPKLKDVAPTCRPEEAEVVLWGDSHAQAWLPFAQSLGTVAEFTMDSCTPALGWGTDHRMTALHRPACDEFNRSAVAYIAGGVDTVVIGARFMDDRMASFPGIRRSVAAVAPHAKRVLVMAPLPFLQKDAIDCIEMHLKCGMTREEFDRFAGPFRRELAAIAASHQNVELVDPTEFFCTESACPMLRNEASLYWDDDHISASASRSFARFYLQR